MRVSSTQQKDEGSSLETQREVGIKKSEELGLGYEIYNEEDKSGRKDDLVERNEIRRLLDNVDKGLVKHVFSWNTDRLSRSLNTWGIIRLKLVKQDVILHTNTGKHDLSTLGDNMMLGIMSEFTHYESSIREKRLQDGRRHKVTVDGNWKGGVGVFGYDTVNKKLVINPIESKWVKKVFKWWGDEGKSPREIKSLMDGRIKTKMGKDYWSLGGIDSMLKNTYYLGYFSYQDVKNIPCERIISDEEYEGVRLRRKELSKHKHRSQKNKRDYYLTSNELLVCGLCDYKMGGITNSHGIGEDKTRYQCNSNRILNIKCEMNKTLICESTDKHVFDVVSEVVKYSVLKREEVKKMMLGKGEDSILSRQKIISNLNKTMKTTQKNLSLIEDRLGEMEVELTIKDITKTQYNKISKSLNNKVSEYQRDIIGFKNELNKLTNEEDGWIDWYNNYLDDMKEVSQYDEKQRISFIKRYVNKIEVFLDESRSIHVLKMYFSLPIVNDKLIWKDKSNKKLGYDLLEGRDIKLLFLKKKERLNPRLMKNLTYLQKPMTSV